jgi:hypothetical protein
VLVQLLCGVRRELNLRFAGLCSQIPSKFIEPSGNFVRVCLRGSSVHRELHKNCRKTDLKRR